MAPKRILLRAAFFLSVTLPLNMTANVLESFTITTQNIEVREFTESSIQLRSDTCSYFIKLEPNKVGKVLFSLSGIGYASTVKYSNLLFGVKITGYRDDAVVYPTFSIDDVNREVVVDHNMLIFPHIYGSLPIWFNEQVDSINLQFSNSMGANMDQYFAIHDLRIIPPIDIASNPVVFPCRQNNIMIAIDGSSSIDKHERDVIGKQLLEFVRKSCFTQDSNQISIVQFGSEILSVVESSDKRALVDALQTYRRAYRHSNFTRWTNWSAVFDDALRRRPDLLIFITDGWSNWQRAQPCSFSAQYETLLAQTNRLKANGTRLLFITSGIDGQRNSRVILSSLLNGEMTTEMHEGTFTSDTDLSTVDLITASSFAAIDDLNFSSIVACPPEMSELCAAENAAVTEEGH